MLKLILPITLFIATALGVTAFAVSSSSSTERADCPGKIVCPLTGDLVCEDRCPVGAESDVANTNATLQLDATREDCPGRIVCPLTGELVCEDRCPVNEETSAEDVAECCRRSIGGFSSR